MQEQAAIARDGLRAAEQVLERRRGRAGRMTRLLRLLELLRIAEQHEALRAGRHREHVGERHLPGLVDEQHVDAVAKAFVRPQPRRAAEQAIRVAREQLRDAIVVVDRVQRLGILVLRLAFVQALEIREPLLAARSHTARSTLRIVSWPTAVTPTFFPAFTSSRIMCEPVKVLPVPGGP